MSNCMGHVFAVIQTGYYHYSRMLTAADSLRVGLGVGQYGRR